MNLITKIKLRAKKKIYYIINILFIYDINTKKCVVDNNCLLVENSIYDYFILKTEVYMISNTLALKIEVLKTLADHTFYLRILIAKLKLTL